MPPDGDLATSTASGVERAGPGEVRVRRALISVSDKAGVVDFAPVPHPVSVDGEVPVVFGRQIAPRPTIKVGGCSGTARYPYPNIPGMAIIRF